MQQCFYSIRKVEVYQPPAPISILVERPASSPTMDVCLIPGMEFFSLLMIPQRLRWQEGQHLYASGQTNFPSSHHVSSIYLTKHKNRKAFHFSQDSLGLDLVLLNKRYCGPLFSLWSLRRLTKTISVGRVFSQHKISSGSVVVVCNYAVDTACSLCNAHAC